MQWSDFVLEVNAQLSVDANRRGLEAFRDRFMRNAVLDLQRYIPAFRQGLTTTYLSTDVEALGQCSLVEMPNGAKPKELYAYSTKDGDNPLCRRYRLDFYPWEKRQDLICGKLDFMTWWGAWNWPVGTCPQNPPANVDGWSWARRKGYVYTIAPHGRSFLVYPAINDEMALLLIWDGYKTEFSPTDTIPFYDGTAEAVANYVKQRITLDVDKNPGLAREYVAMWRERRLSLYRDWQETQDAEGKGDEYDSSVIPPPTNFAAFDAQCIPFLRTITAISGSGTNALEQIGTLSLPTPTTVMILIGGALQIWVLEASTAATAAGLQRPYDYSTANEKCWVQLS